ncbi:MAG TPA: cytochrome c oxidase subunit II [Steroidobacteraceae bacterium]|nr:cytochrome c oxidase subunit II [Steroidobacteraceae bacterium]
MSGATPLTYLTAAGHRAATILPLTWFTLIISVLVCVIIAVLLWGAIRRARGSGGAAETRSVEVEPGPSGARWISIGLLISAVPLLATLIWTMVAIAATSGPPSPPGLTLDVTGHQWWWEVRYDAAEPDRSFETANEIHIPVGVPVRVRLHGGDVIHSFWVPALTGKTDTIPGQTNLSWMEARGPGRFRGQCTEYCGAQHAHMGLEVVAQPQADFDRWRAAQLRPAGAPQTSAQQRGLAVVEYRCGLCHQVRGTQAGAVAAPDLTHLMSRRTLAAGLLPNTPGNLAGWIQNAQEFKPGTLMPNQYLSGQQLSDVQAYLESLQ